MMEQYRKLWRMLPMAEKKKILYIVEAMGGGVFTYIVDLANELVNSYIEKIFIIILLQKK